MGRARRARRCRSSPRSWPPPSTAGCDGSGSGAPGRPVATPAPARRAVAERVDAELGPPSSSPTLDPAHAVDPPGRAPGRRLPADIVVTGSKTLDADHRAIQQLSASQDVEPISLAQVADREPDPHRRGGRPGDVPPLHAAAVAQQQDIWDRVAGGEMAMPTSARQAAAGRRATASCGSATTKDAPRCTSAPTRRRCRSIDAVVNEKWVEELEHAAGQRAAHLAPADRARSPSRPKVEQARSATDASVQMLDAVARYGLDPGALQTAVLTGGSVARRGRRLQLHGARRRPDRPRPRLGAAPTSAPRRCRSSAASPATR